jgi:hypothetical protein
MQKAKVKIADAEFYIFNFAFLIDRTRPLAAGGTDPFPAYSFDYFLSLNCS